MITSAEKTLQRIRDELTGLTWSKRITEWQNSTFGRGSSERLLKRAREEWLELESAFDAGDLKSAAKEAVDVTICLCAFVASVSLDMAVSVQEKMQINVFERRWHSNGDGTGYHIKDDEV